MIFHQQLQKLLVLILLNVTGTVLYAQVNAGAWFSTFHLPAAQLRTTGFGILGQYEVNKSTVYELSAGYFTKKEPLDSFGYLDGSGNYNYARFNDKLSFLQVSADFLRYLAGSTSYKSKFSLYMGAGVSMVVRKTKRSVYISPPRSEQVSLTTFGFEYVLGAELKLGFVRVFVRGKADLFLKYPVPMDDTVIPLLTNAQGGIIIPVIKPEKPHGRVVM